MDPVTVFIGLLVVAVVIRLLAGSFDEDRVSSYLRSKGLELVDKSWDPFGPGWFGEDDSRIYKIIYRDRSGRLHRAHVKTSMLSGVYLTNDEVVDADPDRKPTAEEALREENQYLRNRIRELEKKP